jgi:hypothetical protein
MPVSARAKQPSRWPQHDADGHSGGPRAGWAQSIALVSIAMAGYTAALANMLAMPADVFPAGA